MSNIITFIDPIGRTMLAELVEETETQLTVKNPAIIHVQPTPNGQLNVQTIPLFFKEFVGERNKKEGTIWAYNKSLVVRGLNIENDDRLVQQYQAVFAAPAAQLSGEPQVVKLFDE